MSVAATVREDIQKQFPDLFAAQRVNGRTVDVLETIGTITRDVEPHIEQAMRARRALLSSNEPAARRYAWPSFRERFVDPTTGREVTYREILDGLIDNFFNIERKEAWRLPSRWRLNESVPIPDRVHPTKNPGLELTGPWHPLDMAMNALNSPAVMNMPDFEDASPSHFTPEGTPAGSPLGIFAALQNAKEIFEGRWNVNPYTVVKKGKAREYRITKPMDRWPDRFARPPGLHVRYEQVTVEGAPAPGMIVVAALWALNNYDALTRAGSGVYFYLPKIQSQPEAAIVEWILTKLEDRMGIVPGTLKVKMLYEEGTVGRYLPAVVWSLRRRLLGTNVGRWDYLGSLIEMWKDEKAGVFPDPQTVGMATPSMIAYQRYNAMLMAMAGMKENRVQNGAAIGGMAAVMIYQKGDPYGRSRYNPIALRAMVIDKLRERLIGLIFVPSRPLREGFVPTLTDVVSGRARGTLHDVYRQSWVASPEAEYVAAGNGPLGAEASALQALIDAPPSTVTVAGKPVPTTASGLVDSERALFIERGLLDEKGQILPLVVTPDSVNTPEKLLDSKRWEAIYGVPHGDVTIEHVQHAFYMAANYGFQILNGNFAAAIDDYELKLRFMNDLATYRINVSWLWTLLHHEAAVTRDGRLQGPVLSEDGVVLGAPGREVKAGTPITKDLFEEVCQAHEAWTAAFFGEQDRRGEPSRFDRSKAPLIMELLRRQLLSPRYIQHSARVLFKIGEAQVSERLALFEAIFDLDREELARRVKAGAMSKATLEAHDYVYDVFGPVE